MTIQPKVPSSARLKYDGIGGDAPASILPAERANLVGKHGAPAGRNARNAFEEPATFQTGPSGDSGGNDPCNRNDMDGGFGDDDWGM